MCLLSEQKGKNHKMNKHMRGYKPTELFFWDNKVHTYIWHLFYIYLLDARILKICRKMKFHIGLLNYRQKRTANSARLIKPFWSVYCLFSHCEILISFNFMTGHFLAKFCWDYCSAKVCKTEKIHMGLLLQPIEPLHDVQKLAKGRVP